MAFPAGPVRPLKCHLPIFHNLFGFLPMLTH
jgi:hypothetical protein